MWSKSSVLGMVSAPTWTSSWFVFELCEIIITRGDCVTLILFLASGTGGGFNSDVKIMKIMSSTSSTSVNGVMLMVDITSSSGADPITDILCPPYWVTKPTSSSPAARAASNILMMVL